MKGIFQTWIAEYRKIFTDSGVLLIFFGAIAIYPFFYSLPYLPEVFRDIPVAVVDCDHSPMSRKLIRMLDAHENLAVVLLPQNLEEAKKAIFKRDVSGVIVIPADFERQLLRRERPAVSLYSDASYFLTYRQITMGCTQVVRTFSAGIEILRLQAEGYTPNQAMAVRAPVQGVTYPLFNSAGGYATFLVQLTLVVLLQQTLLIGIGLLAGTDRQKKEAGIIEGQRLFETGPLGNILGKCGAYFSIYFMHAFYLFLIVPHIFNFPLRGNPLAVLAFMTPFLLATGFLGIALSGWFKSREAAIIVIAFTSIPVIMISGFSWPAQAMPAWLYRMSMVLPSTSGINGFLTIGLMGGTLGDAVPESAILWGLTAVYFLLALITTRRTLKKEAPDRFRTKIAQPEIMIDTK